MLKDLLSDLVDGLGDVIISAPGWDQPANNAGAVFVWSGGGLAGSLTTSSANMQVRGVNAGDDFGRTLSVGDVDGDSFPDILVDAPGWGANEGRAYWFLGTNFL